MKHLLAIETSTGKRWKPSSPARNFRRGHPAGHQEGAGPAGPDRGQPLLRVQHPDLFLLRTRREASLGRRGLGQGEGVRGRQGRIPQGHGRDTLGVRPGGDRDPPSLRGRGPARRRAGRRRRWSTPATASTSTPARPFWTCWPCAAGSGRMEGKPVWIVGDVLHSRVARSNLTASG